MTALLPHVISHAVTAKTVFGASQSFAVVTLTLLVVLLIEREALRAVRVQSARVVALSIVCAPLLIAVTLTIVARLVLLIL